MYDMILCDAKQEANAPMKLRVCITLREQGQPKPPKFSLLNKASFDITGDAEGKRVPLWSEALRLTISLSD